MFLARFGEGPNSLSATGRPTEGNRTPRSRDSLAHGGRSNGRPGSGKTGTLRRVVPPFSQRPLEARRESPGSARHRSPGPQLVVPAPFPGTRRRGPVPRRLVAIGGGLSRRARKTERPAQFGVSRKIYARPTRVLAYMSSGRISGRPVPDAAPEAEPTQRLGVPEERSGASPTKKPKANQWCDSDAATSSSV
jgi:hypothetical protein